MNSMRSAGGERDEKLTSLYRASLPDEPPAALDEAIRAAAYRAAGAAPRLAGASLRRWRVPVSIAAVVVLSASLVLMMREEAPEVMAPPGTELPVPRAGDAAERARPSAPESAPPGMSPAAKEGGNLGLKPPREAASGIGLRGPETARQGYGSSVETPAPVERDSAPSALAKRAPPAAAFPGNDGPRGSVAAIERQREPNAERGRLDRESRIAEPARAAPPPPLAPEPANVPDSVPPGAAESQPALKSESAAAGDARERTRPLVQAAPRAAARPEAPVAGAAAGHANLPPDKWLDQIEALRKQGRGEEARAMFAEFRRRYPEYPLPEALQGWEKR